MRPGMDAAVGHELLEREPRDLAADRVEAGDDDGVRRVVDDDVDAGGELERADVAPLAADDAPLHLVVRQRHGRDGGLGRVLGGDALDGQRDDLLGLALGVALGRLADLAQPVGGVGLGLLLHAPHQLGLGLFLATCRPSAPAAAAPRRPASRAPPRARRRSSRAGRARSRACRSPCRAPRRARAFRSSWLSRSSSRRSSRSTSSRRRRASASQASRSLISSSLPATTALFRIVSASRSASPMMRLDVSSAVDFASA